MSFQITAFLGHIGTVWADFVPPSSKRYIFALVWPLLKWSCKDKKEGERRGEIDLRNQLVHNLRGMKKSDVVEYLMGYQKVETDNVIKVYNEKVKQPFFEVIRLFKLDYTRDKLDKELKDLAKSLS